MINIKFLIVTVCLFFLSLLNLAGQTKESEIKTLMWKDDPDFAVKDAGNRWKGESAIILCKSYEYRVWKEFFFNNMSEKIYIHQRILLQDQAAVNMFSKLKFNYSSEPGLFFDYKNHDKYIGIKIIKPDGSEKEIDIVNAAEDIYTEGNSTEKIKKIAVPGLTTGDIIDYYYCTEKNMKIPGFFAFDPVIYSLVENFPVLKQKVTLHIMRRCYLSARSMNGAPKLKFIHDSERSDMIYTLTDTCIEKMKNQLWLYPMRELPILIFQAYTNVTPLLKNRYCFYDSEDVIKKSVSDEELLDYMNFYSTISKVWKTGKVYRYIKKHCKNEKNTTIKVREAYNYLRQLYYFKDYDLTTDPGKFGYQLSESVFILTLSDVLKKLGILNSIVMTVPREYGTIKDMIMPNQAEFLLMVKADSTLFINNFTPFSLFNEVDASYQGNFAKAINTELDAEERDIYNVNIPQMKYTNNSTFNRLIISFKPTEPEKEIISCETKITGLQKFYYQAQLITAAYYITACNNKYNIKIEKNTSNPESNIANNQTANDREKTITKIIETEYDLENEVKLNNFNLIQPGMWDDAPELKYRFEFETGKFVNQENENFIVEAGKLIGMQIYYPPEDSVRKYNIYMAYARIFENELNIEIPVGYQVKGIDKFNYDINNITGGFTSSASIDNNRVIIKTKKYFLNNYEKYENWPWLREIIDAANNFRNQKILLVKQ